MIKRAFTISVLCLFLILLVKSAVLALDFPQPVGYVNDFASILSQKTKDQLENKLAVIDKELTVEIAVVTVESLQDTTIEDYAVRLFEDWKIGKREQDNGVLLLVAPVDKEVRIEVGYGLEPVLTDSKAGRIIRDIMIPSFKGNDYDTGIVLGTEAIIKSVKEEDFPSFTTSRKEVREVVSSIPVFFFLGGILFTYLSAFLGRTKEIWPGGMIGAISGGLLGWLVLKTALLILISSSVLGILGLFLDAIFSRNYKARSSSGLPTSWRSSGGGFFGGRSDSGGFSGFGGGSSGGGGASGKW